MSMGSGWIQEQDQSEGCTDTRVVCVCVGVCGWVCVGVCGCV